ncbi:MAG: aminodeoxychorismate synthase component I, partial [Gemmataceae bacterium]
SYVMADPVSWHTARPGDPNPLPSFDIERPRMPQWPPFQGGYAGLLSYDAAPCFEVAPSLPGWGPVLPPIALGFYDCVMAFDHQKRRGWLISTGAHPTDPPDQQRALKRLNAMIHQLNGPAPELQPPKERRFKVPAASAPLPGWDAVWSNFSREDYLHRLRRAIDYIHAGDCFQVNLAQQLFATVDEHPWTLYERLRSVNPAPFAAYFDLGSHQLLSASPERYLQLQDSTIITRPIKGTRPRQTDPEADALLQHDLRTNPKDRAENVMIVDLLRNDLGRVARFGSVQVPKVCELETFRFVHHLVSEVRAELAPGRGIADLLRASFPGGSITGAPKVRAMEIIAELEQLARGAYCGSLGFFTPTATDSNILIRTITVADGWAQLPVGGGIVADSV